MDKLSILLITLTILFLFLKNRKSNNNLIKEQHIDYNFALSQIKLLSKNSNNLFTSIQIKEDLEYSSAETFQILGKLIDSNEIIKLYELRCSHCEGSHIFHSAKEIDNLNHCEVCNQKLEHNDDFRYSLYKVLGD